MVLEGATSSDSSFSDTLPTSDIDPYASGTPPYSNQRDAQLVLVTPQPNGIYINLNTLPRRWSIIGEKPHPKALVESLKDSNRFAATVLQRPVTQQEADAFAFHFAKSFRIASYGTPIGVLGGTAWAYRSNKDMRFPGWTPFKEGSRFSKDVFGPLKGNMARTAWQLSRVSAWQLVWAITAQIFFGSYAISVGLAGRAMDPRLKEFTEALKARVQNGVGKKNTGIVGNQEAGPKGLETYDMARQRRDAQGIGRSGLKWPKESSDDASPTGGAFSDDHGETMDSTGFLSEEDVRHAADARSESPRNQNSSAFEQSAVASRQSTGDNASPRVGREASASRQSGSTWDRLRTDAMSGEQKRSVRGTQPSQSTGSRASAQGGANAPLGDSFSFSSSDEERQLAKSEAQRDFDARIEREREGRSFDEKSGGRDKW
ncbi:hypothetical protein LTR08_002610 [Meristemomyces frigidus]|nr:hypothetical protein LTR08_002610 [Meristemomyces frigidus]